MNASDPNVNIDNAYTQEYREVLNKIQNHNKACPFCPGQMTEHKHPIELEGEHWLVTKNSFNYQAAKYPYLFIHKEHITDFSQVTAEAWEDLRQLYSQLIEKYQMKGGAIFMRFGDPRMTGATVVHLHAHLVSADPDRDNKDPIMARIG